MFRRRRRRVFKQMYHKPQLYHERAIAAGNAGEEVAFMRCFLILLFMAVAAAAGLVIALVIQCKQLHGFQV